MKPPPGLSEFLQGLARLATEAGRESSAFFVLDGAAGVVVAGGGDAGLPAIDFSRRGDGTVEGNAASARLAVRIAPMRAWGTQAPLYLVFVHDRASDALAAATLDFALRAVGHRLDAGFEIENLSLAVTRLFEERSFLYEIGKEIGGLDDLPRFCRRLASRLAALLAADRTGVALVSPDRTAFHLAGTHRLPVGDGAGWSVGAGATGRALAERRALLFEGMEKLPADAPAFERQMRETLVVAPIDAGGQAIGALVAIDGERAGGLGNEEKVLLEFVAEYLGSLVLGLRESEMRREMQIARRIVEGLLPAAPPPMRRFTLAGRLVPARDVGGDYYDFLEAGGGRIGVVVADVSGHNLPATLLVTAARSAFRWEIADGRSAGEVMARVAGHLHEDLARAELFLSMAFLLVGEGGEVRFAIAGHPAPLLRRANGTFEELVAEGPVAGVFANAAFEERGVRMEPGDCLVVYTDGVTEAAGAEGLFGEERLRRTIDRACADGAEAVVEAVFREVEAHCGGPASDDLTVVAIQAVSDPARARAETGLEVSR